MLKSIGFLFVVLLFSGCGGGSSSGESNNSKGLTLGQCERDYAGYDNSQWAQATGAGPNRAKASACYQALVAGPLVGQGPQLYIDAYNRGDYDNIKDHEDTNSDDNVNDGNSNKTGLDYMKTHPAEKLSSSDCKFYKGGGETVVLEWVGGKLQTNILQWKHSWSDVLSALRYDLAPADNMYKSISACKNIQTAVEYGNMSYSEAVSVTKRNFPDAFSD